MDLTDEEKVKIVRSNIYHTLAYWLPDTDSEIIIKICMYINDICDDLKEK